MIDVQEKLEYHKIKQRIEDLQDSFSHHGQLLEADVTKLFAVDQQLTAIMKAAGILTHVLQGKVTIEDCISSSKCTRHRLTKFKCGAIMKQEEFLEQHTQMLSNGDSI